MLLNSESLLSVKLKPIEWTKKDFPTLQDCKNWCDDVIENHKNIEIYRNFSGYPTIYFEDGQYYVFIREI